MKEQLKKIRTILDSGLNPARTAKVLALMGGGKVPSNVIKGMRTYSDHLPKAKDVAPTYHQRYLHFLWDSLDKLPMSVVANFAIPFRRMIAERLFKKCGKNFIADENVRFNFGQLIEVGDDVFINRGSFLDSKGGIRIGNGVGIAEFVVIFTHSHSESDHAERTYAPVVIDDHAKIYTSAMILPGVTVGKEAIVAAKALVTRDVPAGVVVGGTPAKEIRARNSGGRSGRGLNHIWLAEGAFQTE